MRGFFLALLLIVAAAGFALYKGANNVPTNDERVKAAWSQVQNQYERRADLIPNLVETVKGYAHQEKDVLTAVVEARAKATQVQIDPTKLSDPAVMKQYQDAQATLSGALGKLLSITEAYPDLKSNQNFLALQSQLEGTENRIAVARKDYIDAVRVYNTDLRGIPGRWIAAILYPDAKVYEPLTVAPEKVAVPKVQIN